MAFVPPKPKIALAPAPPASYRPQATGYRRQATGYRLRRLATGYSRLATGYRLPPTAYRLPATGDWLLATGDWRLATRDWRLATAYRLQATGYGLPATGYRLPATAYRLRATGYGLQATGYRLQAHRLQATGYRLQATGYRHDLLLLKRTIRTDLSPMPAPLASKEEIIDRLFTVFRDRGFEGASLADLSRATGLGKSSLYHYFPQGKEQMAEAVLARALALIDSAIVNAARAPEPLRLRLRKVAAALEQLYGGGRFSCVLGQLSTARIGPRLERACGKPSRTGPRPSPYSRPRAGCPRPAPALLPKTG